MRLPTQPEIIWKADGTPVDARVDDVYFSREDGLSEARAVFLAGCGLPEEWQGRTNYTVAELGFGTGLNFLALWQMWRATRVDAGWLHFVSFEGFPLDRSDAEKALGTWPKLADLREKLLRAWPVRAKGVRRFTWPDERLTLTLHIGDISETLPASELLADAWFLDGFSPAKNDRMWDDALWPLVAKRTRPGGRAATFTVAGAVRRGLASAGFDVTRAPGHGRKRQRLEAVLPGSSQTEPRTPKKIAIIGAGIAGAHLAYTLGQRGADVTVYDRASGPAQGTSGNPLALVMPRLDATDTVQARLLIDAYLVAQKTYADLPGSSPIEVHHRPRDPAEATRFEKVLADPPLGLSQLEATQDGVLHKQAVVVEPARLIPALLERADLQWGGQVDVDLENRTVNATRFDAIILATGWHMVEALPWLKLQCRAGQVNWVETDVTAPPAAITQGGYAIASNGLRLWGATYAPLRAMGKPQPSADATAENKKMLNALNPYWRAQVETCPEQARAGVRAAAPDRLPVIGALPDVEASMPALSAVQRSGQPAAQLETIPGVYIAGGFGSRGFTWAPWAAAILTARLFNDPSPASIGALAAIDPGRQLVRDARRGLLKR